MHTVTSVNQETVDFSCWQNSGFPIRPLADRPSVWVGEDDDKGPMVPTRPAMKVFQRLLEQVSPLRVQPVGTRPPDTISFQGHRLAMSVRTAANHVFARAAEQRIVATCSHPTQSSPEATMDESLPAPPASYRVRNIFITASRE